MIDRTTDRRLAQFGWMLHAIGACGAFGIVVAYQFGMSTTFAAELDQYVREARHVEARVAGSKRLRLEHQALTEQLADLRQRAKMIRQRIPDQPLEAEFLQQLTEIADSEGLTIRDYQRGSASVTSTHSQLEIRIEGEGDYAGLCGFLDRIARLPRVARVQFMQVLEPADAEQMMYPIDISLMLYFGVRQT